MNRSQLFRKRQEPPEDEADKPLRVLQEHVRANRLQETKKAAEEAEKASIKAAKEAERKKIEQGGEPGDDFAAVPTFDEPEL